MLYDIPLLMVLIFLGFTLVVGLYGNPRANTFREYAVGSKQFHTIILMITVLATTFGNGVLMRNAQELYDIGMHYIVLLCVMVVGFWITSLLVLRMGPFLEHLSVAETIGSVYGKYPRAIVAALGICFSIGMVAIQISVMSSAISMCIDSIDPRIVTVLATLILIAYTMLGGINAVAITDILQFATFTIVIPLLIRFVFVKTGKSFLEIIVILQKQEKFQFSNFLQFDKKLLKLVLSSLGFISFLHLSVVQRVYMSSGPIQAYKVFLRVTLFSAIIAGCIALIGWLVFVDDPTLPVTELWSYLSVNMSPVCKGCVAISLLGLAMSTADSSLHTASVMVGHDLLESIQGIKPVPYVHQLLLAKLATLVTGLLAMVITVFYSDLMQLCSFFIIFLIIFFEIIVIPPFVLAILGFRGSSRTALIGMSIGILVYFICKHLLKPTIGIDNEIIAVAANGLAMMVAHYLLLQPANKGWTGKNNQQKRIQQLIRVFKQYKKSIDLE